MKQYLIKIFAPGDAHNFYKIWVAISLIIQALATLVPAMILHETSSLNEVFLYGSIGVAFIGLILTKSSWQRTIAYSLALFGLLMSFVYVVLDLTNTGIFIYLLAWSMSVSLGYGREYYNLKWFFAFMSGVLILFALGLYFAPNTDYTGLEKLVSIASGTVVIAVNIYLWSREAKMNSNHYSERRQKYEDIASLSGKVSLILVSNDHLEKVFLNIAKESVPLLQMDRCMIYLPDEDGKLKAVDGSHSLSQTGQTLVAECFRKAAPMMISDSGMTNFTSTIADFNAKSEIAAPIFDVEKVSGVIYGCSKERNVFRDRHYQAFNVIASFCGVKITQYYAIESIRTAERTKAEVERYKELDTLKNRFIANVSHDLKTPLSLIKAPAKQIAQLTKDDKIRSLASYITQNSDHLLRVVHQLLELNRVDKGINELYFSSVDLKKLCHQIKAQYEERAESKGLELAVTSDEINMQTDVFRLEQIIHNLLGNALRYTEKGRVRVVIRAQDNRVFIEVQDTGIGIPKEMQQNVFERFFKVDQNNQEGTGIGLSLVHEYVGVLEGKISLKSEVGIGTQFFVELPLVHSEAEAGAIEAEHEKHELPFESGAKPHMLVVEDHAGLNDFICTYFEGKYFPISAFDGEEALQKMAQQLPDVIITDLMMPRRDGKSFVEEVRANDEYAHIPIIVLSANSQLSSKVELYESGVDNFIAKPFEIEELEAVVKATLTRRKDQRDDFRHKFLEFPEEAALTTSEAAQDLISKLKELLLTELDNGELTVNDVAATLGYGRNRFQKEIKALTGVTPVEFIRSLRLEEARKMLVQDPSKNISEVAYAVGFSNLSYFTRSFRQEFDKLPSEMYRTLT